MQTPDQRGLAEHPPSDQALLRQYLADRDTACPACGYNLRQLQTSTCPECGRRIELRISLTDGMSGAWITALVGALVPAACGLPFQILMLIAFAYGEFSRGLPNEPVVWVMLLLLFYSLICWVVSILLIVMRRRFMKLRAQTQSAIATTLIFALIGAVITVIGAIASI